MPTDDPTIPTWLREQLGRQSQRDTERRARLQSCEPLAGAGDIYAVPLPVPGPETWCVTEVCAGDEVRVVPIDRRPFYATDDLWTELDGDICLRRAAACTVHRGDLPATARVDHLAAIETLLADNPADTVASIDAEPTAENAWRTQLDRASRMLLGWLAERSLRLRIADLQDEASAEDSPLGIDVERQSKNPERRTDSQPRLAAANKNSAELFRRALADSTGVHRWEEVHCEGGRLVLVASRRGIGFLFEPEADSAAPPLFWTTSGDDHPAVWSAESNGCYRVFWPHDWSTGPGHVRVAVRQPFTITLDDAGFWS